MLAREFVSTGEAIIFLTQTKNESLSSKEYPPKVLATYVQHGYHRKRLRRANQNDRATAANGSNKARHFKEKPVMK